ncbi:F-box only protein 32 [Operophtera brumata]|uniref:F-box only protein 32 n=1 Tax=Operophtera brumata TaxID=104452 RepID=A0A0L7LCX1_OPEBR|nr:F-box only protein 32 [Operophtera brumata]
MQVLNVIAGFNGLSEAVRRLDFSSAVRDVRRFNYICALLELLLGEQRLTHLPGAAQKLLLSMLEQLADQVALTSLREAERAACWGRPLGSRALWGHHDHAIARINRIANAIRIQESASSAWNVMASVCNEQRIWRSLVAFHFSPQQTELELAKLEAKGDKDTDWKKLFHQLRK